MASNETWRKPEAHLRDGQWPISIMVSPAWTHPVDIREQVRKWVLLRASQRSHHFPCTQTRNQMTALYCEVKGWEKTLEPLVCFLHSHSSSIISFNAEIILLVLMAWLQALDGVQTTQGKCPRRLGCGILHPVALLNLDPQTHSHSCIPGRPLILQQLGPAPASLSS